MAITGGGLAGLALSIQLSRLSYKVILFEKEQYPFHKVCGEYISMESWDFLMWLGVDLENINVSKITQLEISSSNGRMLRQKLPLGGFGISRYNLDMRLVKLAELAGVVVMEHTKVNDIVYTSNEFIIDTSEGNFIAAVACGSFGKRSNLDVKWKRPFSSALKNRLNNYIGVKYHVQCNYDINTIALHNFKDGYCGIVKIEDDKYCVCYLSKAGNLKTCNGSIAEMEHKILSANPHLKKFFSEVKVLHKEPLTISQISFDKKSQSENNVVMIGDAAGMITPLCGNGMSMALHSSKIAAEQMHAFLQGTISRKAMEETYTSLWQKQFGRRLRAGRLIQKLLSSNSLGNLLISAGKHFPGFVKFLVRQTHGRPF